MKFQGRLYGTRRRVNPDERLPAVPLETVRQLGLLWGGNFDPNTGRGFHADPIRFWRLARAQYHAVETASLLKLLQEITEGAYTNDELVALLESREVEGLPVHEKRKSGDLDLTELHRTHAIEMGTTALHQWLGDAHYDRLPDPYGSVVLTGVARQESVSALVPIARQKALALADVYGLSLGFRPTVVWARTKMFTDQHGKRRRGTGFHIVFPVISEPSKMAKGAAKPRRHLNPAEPRGDCYRQAAELVLDQDRWGKGGPRLYLVHGEPTLQRPPFCRYGHAWVEYTDDQGNVIVRDPTAGVEMPAVLYYALGNIDASATRAYEADEITRWIMQTRHWGPWEGSEAP